MVAKHQVYITSIKRIAEDSSKDGYLCSISEKLGIVLFITWEKII